MATTRAVKAVQATEAAADRTLRAVAAASDMRRTATDLRKAGASYSQIAKQVGYATTTAAHKAVGTVLADNGKEPTAEVVRMELERLDAMLLGLWAQARSGHLGAVDRVLKIMERRAAYLGLDG
jgi:hypothetical protein